MMFSLVFILFVSLFVLPSGYAEDKSFEHILQLAEKGDADAQFDVGICYFLGEPALGMPPSELIEQNYEKAIYWYEKSAEQGNVKAQRNLGRMYEEGIGVAQDYQKARKWYEKAAKGEDLDALFRLATLHYKGLGGSQNFKEALDLYKRAATLNPGAQYMVAYMYYKGQGVSGNDNYVQAANWFKQNAYFGDPRGMLMLGIFYKHGVGVQKDYRKAYAWFSLANKIGTENADEYGQVAAKAREELIELTDKLNASDLSDAKSLFEEYQNHTIPGLLETAIPENN